MQNKKSYSKFAVVINKKFGKSIQRNKAKRQVRALYRVNKSKQKAGYNIIFFIKNGFKNISFSKKKENYLQLIKKADLNMNKGDLE